VQEVQNYKLALRFGHTEVVHSLLEYGAGESSQEESKDGSTLLHLAFRRGHVEVACLLIEHGMDATAINKHGWTVLHLASRWGHLDVAQFLLDAVLTRWPKASTDCPLCAWHFKENAVKLFASSNAA
jgi:ankyrin repeat protein